MPAAKLYHAIATTDGNGAVADDQLALVQNAACIVSPGKPLTKARQQAKSLIFAINEDGVHGFVPAESVKIGERWKCTVGETSGVALPSCRFQGATTPRFCYTLNTHAIITVMNSSIHGSTTACKHAPAQQVLRNPSQQLKQAPAILNIIL